MRTAFWTGPSVSGNLPKILAAASDSDKTGAVRKARELVEKRDPCLIIFTTGSTGSPKPALLCHENILTQNITFRRLLHDRRRNDIPEQPAPLPYRLHHRGPGHDHLHGRHDGGSGLRSQAVLRGDPGAQDHPRPGHSGHVYHAVAISRLRQIRPVVPESRRFRRPAGAAVLGGTIAIHGAQSLHGTGNHRGLRRDHQQLHSLHGR